jgi:hypothetical protein
MSGCKNPNSTGHSTTTNPPSPTTRKSSSQASRRRSSKLGSRRPSGRSRETKYTLSAPRCAEVTLRLVVPAINIFPSGAASAHEIDHGRRAPVDATAGGSGSGLKEGSRFPSDKSRRGAVSPCATRMRPSAWTEIAAMGRFAISAAATKFGSQLPSRSSRTRFGRSAPLWVENEPATRTRPSGWAASAAIRSGVPGCGMAKIFSAQSEARPPSRLSFTSRPATPSATSTLPSAKGSNAVGAPSSDPSARNAGSTIVGGAGSTLRVAAAEVALPAAFATVTR